VHSNVSVMMGGPPIQSAGDIGGSVLGDGVLDDLLPVDVHLVHKKRRIMITKTTIKLTLSTSPL
jgi:hypothetical protein